MDRCKCGNMPQFKHEKKYSKDKKTYDVVWRVECECGVKTKNTPTKAAALKEYEKINKKKAVEQPKKSKGDIVNV